MEEAFLQLLALGPTGVISAVFLWIWRDSKKEQREEREAMVMAHREERANLVKTISDITQKYDGALRDFTEAVTRLTDRLPRL